MYGNLPAREKTNNPAGINGTAMSTTTINTYEDLTGFFTEAYKPSTEWQIGLEFEKLGVHTDTARAIPYSGPDGVEEILFRLAQHHGWTPHKEEGRILSLQRDQSLITLEPGAQFELSGRPHETLHGVAEEIQNHLQELQDVSPPEKVAWLGIGNQPLSKWPDIELIPKQRYAIMNRYLPTQGEHAQAMMREIAAVQLNLDYADEKDAMEKFRLAMCLSPLFTALFANSSISGGQPNGFLTRRAYIWQHTDPHRCGFVERLYHPEAGFSDYIDYALEVPMFFVVREEEPIEIAGAVTFKQYLESGFKNYQACWDDWVLHLSTIFTEARFKPFLEVRGIDCPPPDLVMTFPALVKGLFYDCEARQRAGELVSPWSLEQRRDLFINISRKGLNTIVRGIQARELIIELIQLSRKGLQRQGRLNARGEDEAIFLEPLEARLEQGLGSPARETLAHWNTDWQKNLSKLIDFYRF